MTYFAGQYSGPNLLHFIGRYVLHFAEECGCPVVIDFAVFNLRISQMVCGTSNDGFYIALPLFFLKCKPRTYFVTDTKFRLGRSLRGIERIAGLGLRRYNNAD